MKWRDRIRVWLRKAIRSSDRAARAAQNATDIGLFQNHLNNTRDRLEYIRHEASMLTRSHGSKHGTPRSHY